MVNPEEFLFIEPKQPPAAEPIIDELTRQVTAAWRATKPSEYGYRGFHVCECGVASDSHDHFLPSGKNTNSLCVHYVAFHRHELSREDKTAILVELVACMCGEAEPTEKELHRPRRKHY
jgi:hypothetical protein